MIITHASAVLEDAVRIPGNNSAVTVGNNFVVVVAAVEVVVMKIVAKFAGMAMLFLKLLWI